MYNKIFTKILDSSIWLEADSTRLVWLTCIAAMDEDGFCQFASPANLAHRANVTLTACLSALDVLEGPDPNSSDPDHEGRRLERVPGGWMVRNSAKYREMVSREIAKAANRRRVYRHREKASSNGSVMPANGVSPSANGSVTLSDTEADTETGSEAEADDAKPSAEALMLPARIGKQSPVRDYPRLRVFPWMLHDLIGMLGEHSEAFDLDAYLLRLDSSGEVLPAKIWPWLKDRVSAEAASRGLSAQIPAAAPTNKRIAGLMAGGEAFLKRVAEQKARQS